ncbi:Heat shock cognate 71 kDa protein [Cricetulus griseus]|uniref:Heat shock cognate 71 kDa protein n=1 Tax=Cricetulus griseus TaxID=10029 RepID=G3ILE5_CRIGR|nr:Heat shock cognate 71 kDa protein [Cricetulus griseus]
MVQEAEQYKAEDEKQRDKVSSKNSLESYAFNMKATDEDEKLQGKINDEDKQKILDKCNDIISWLDKNQTAKKEEFEHQQKELEKVCNPSLPRCTRMLVASLEECLGASLVVGLLHLVVLPQGLPPKRWIKSVQVEV